MKEDIVLLAEELESPITALGSSNKPIVVMGWCVYTTYVWLYVIILAFSVSITLDSDFDRMLVATH